MKTMKLAVVYHGVVLCAIVFGVPVGLETWARHAAHDVPVSPRNAVPAAALCAAPSGVARQLEHQSPPPPPSPPPPSHPPPSLLPQSWPPSPPPASLLNHATSPPPPHE